MFLKTPSHKNVSGVIGPSRQQVIGTAMLLYVGRLLNSKKLPWVVLNIDQSGMI